MPTIKFTIPGPPVPKPRMTQADKWQKRPCVVKYWQWAETARMSFLQVYPGVELPGCPSTIVMRFYLPFPPSYSMKKRRMLAGALHRETPDLLNLGKAAEDALWPQDKGLAREVLSKWWDDGGGPRTEIEIRWEG